MFVLQSFKASTKRKPVTIGFISTAKVRVSFGLSLLKSTKMNRPITGIATDAAHSTKRLVTEYQGVNVETGERIFYKNLGNQTVNIGEFLAVVEAAKYIIENDFQPRIIYSDSVTAITWFRNKKTASKKRNKELQKAEIFLKALAYDIDTIDIRHWDNNNWGEIPADFGNK
jgi:ribonuclease HI